MTKPTSIRTRGVRYFYLMLFSTLIGYSQSFGLENGEKKKEEAPTCKPCEYESACCPEKSSWGTFAVKGEFLYWQPDVTGMAYALTHTRVTIPFNPFGSDSPLPDKLSIQNVSFNYSPGFRVGARYTLPKTQWDVSCDYTQFTKTGHASVSADSQTFIDTLWDAVSAVLPIQAKSELEVRLKVINTTIGKSIELPHCFTFRPNVGFQVYKLDCEESIQYIGTTVVDSAPQNSTASVQLLNNTRGWGLLIGFDAIWRLPYYFEIFGRSDYGIERTSFSFSQNQQTVVTTQPTSNLNSNSQFASIIQSVQVMAGIGWNYIFNCSNHPLALRLYAAYEMDVWLQNVQVTRALSLGTGYSDALTTNIGNVGFRGLTAGAKFTF